MEFARLSDYPKYRIYKNGDVYSEWGKTDRLLKRHFDKDGYNYVGMHNGNGNKQQNFKIHRLLAMLFLPCNVDFSTITVDHINRVKADNRLENLRWLCRCRQQLNKNLKDTNTGYPFITKHIKKSNKSGFGFKCDIRRNNKYVLTTSRAKLEDAIELVRTFLLENEYIFYGYPDETKNKIKEIYNINFHHLHYNSI
jgi:hypothetical protein